MKLIESIVVGSLAAAIICIGLALLTLLVLVVPIAVYRAVLDGTQNTFYALGAMVFTLVFFLLAIHASWNEWISGP